jgi:hypothetical protein
VLSSFAGNLLIAGFLLVLPFDSDDEADAFFGNVDGLLPSYTALQTGISYAL